MGDVTKLPVQVVGPEDVFEMCMTDLNGQDCHPVSAASFVKMNHHVRSKQFVIENECGEQFVTTITVEPKDGD